MKHLDSRGLPQCSLSAHCLRLIDALDPSNVPQPLEQFPLEDDIGDERLLEQLRTHVPGCPTCTAVLAEGRRMRAQQRAALHDLLAEAEQHVPSTTAHIMAAIRKEQVAPAHANGHQKDIERIPTQQLLEEFSPQPSTPLPVRRPRPVLRNALSWAAVLAIILASIALFGRLVLLHSNLSAAPTATPLPSTHGWDSLVIAIPAVDAAGQTVIENYEPFSGKSRQLLTAPTDAVFDGVSHDGQNLLYESPRGGAYRLLSGKVFQVQGQGSNAVWTTNDRYVLTATADGVIQIDVQSGEQQTWSYKLNADNLAFYRDDYLYFTRTDSNATSMLHRINLASGVEQQIAQGASNSSADYWLSPDGTTIYYAAGSGRQSIYAVNSDGHNVRKLRDNGIPIGFAADNSLMILHQVSSAFQVVKLGAQEQQDKVVLSDAAPGAVGIAANGAALAPYGQGLAVQAYYPDNSIKLWADDLRTATKHILMTLPAPAKANPVQLVGWDRMPVAIAPSPTVQPSPVATQSPAATLSPTVPPSWDGWNTFVLATPPANGFAFAYNYDYRTGSGGPISDKLPANTVFDGIAPDGKNLLYQAASSGHTLYFTLNDPLPNTGFFYELNDDNAGKAIWLDSTQVLIATMHMGVVEVNVQTGHASTLVSSLNGAGIQFYRDGYLYFTSAQTMPEGDTLHRINVATNAIQTLSNRTMDPTFWLSPDGSTVYYFNGGPVGQPGTYAVNSDGTGSHLVSPDGKPIGFAADDSLMLMRRVNGVFQVVRLDASSGQEVLVMNDVVPGASLLCVPVVSNAVSPVCEADVALAPYGHALIVQAFYPDGSHKLWSIDLVTGQGVVVVASTTDPIHLIGWSRMSVSGG